MKKLLDGLDYNLARAATRCAFFVKMSSLTLEQAAFAFHHVRLHNADLEEFLFLSGWVNWGNIASIRSEVVPALAAA